MKVYTYIQQLQLDRSLVALCLDVDALGSQGDGDEEPAKSYIFFSQRPIIFFFCNFQPFTHPSPPRSGRMNEDTIIPLINDCKIATDPTQKSTLLAQLQEAIFNRGNRQLFRDYWQVILEFEADPSPVAKKWLANILNLASKKEYNCKYNVSYPYDLC